MDSSAVPVRALPTTAFRRALDWIGATARPLDRTHAEFLFPREAAGWKDEGARSIRSALASVVLSELQSFQNSDGGFFGLEPDIRTPASSPIATSVAFQYMRSVRADPALPIVRRALTYLTSTFDPKRNGWPTIGPEVNEAPHAPWWQFDPTIGATYAGSLFNPTAELAAAFLHFGGVDRPSWLNAVVEDRIQALLGSADDMAMHDLLTMLALYDALDERDRERIHEKLVRVGTTIVTRDSSQWSAYAVKPLWLAPSPDAILAEALRPEVMENISWEVDQQKSDGTWAPNWTWDGAYPEAWELAEKEWRGVLTVRVLQQLRDWGALEKGG